MNLFFLRLDICNYMSWYIRSFFGFTFLNILYFFKYSCTNIFHRRSLYTFYVTRKQINTTKGMWPSDQLSRLVTPFRRQTPVTHLEIQQPRWTLLVLYFQMDGSDMAQNRDPEGRYTTNKRPHWLKKSKFIIMQHNKTRINKNMHDKGSKKPCRLMSSKSGSIYE